jgi:hypothetical protein
MRRWIKDNDVALIGMAISLGSFALGLFVGLAS